MAYNLLCTYYEDNKVGETFDITELAHDIEFTTSLESQPGRFTFYLEKDPHDVLKINIGSIIQFFSDAKIIFYGKVFTIETDATDVCRITAYDMMRYLKNQDSIIIDGTDSTMTLRKMFIKIMRAYNLNYHISSWYKQINLFPLEQHNFQSESLFDILDWCMISEELKHGLDANLKGKLIEIKKDKNYFRRFYLKCNGENIELREIYYDLFYNENGEPKNTFLLIGDESLLNNYRYKVDIDQDTYNRFIFVANKETDDSSEEDTNKQVQEQQMVAAMDAGYVISKTGTKLDGKKIGESTISKWGILSKIIELNTTEKTNEVVDYMKSILEIYSQPARTLTLNAIGYDGITAGSAFFLHLSKLGVNYPVYVLSATHRYDSNEHMMELQVSTNINMRTFL